MTTDDIIILLLYYSKDEMIAGRTLLQKTLYFLNKKLNLGIDFSPYYYGPYSREITEELENLKASDIICEEIKEFKPIDYHVTFEPRKYIYSLGETGAKLAEKLEERDPILAKGIKQTLEFMRDKDATNNYKVLSIAAKMDNILESENKPMYVDEILEEAKILGWIISKEEAQCALTLLKKLEMVDNA
ncbi:MAG: hypothetical protein WAW52_03980 [Methanothrix sp.]